MRTAQMSIMALLLFVPYLGAVGSDPISHSTYSILFEIYEYGTLSRKRVALNADALKTSDGSLWAECRLAILTINNDQKRVEIDAYSCSTDETVIGRIEDLHIEEDRFSFEIFPYPLAPERGIKMLFIKSEIYRKYNAEGIGLWSSLWDTSKVLIKIEWRQVDSLKLPYDIVGGH